MFNLILGFNWPTVQTYTTQQQADVVNVSKS